jgi:PAS domain S-box-containing protein
MGRRKTSGQTTITTPNDAILESISDGVFTVDMDWRISSFNRAAEEITGVPRREAFGRPCSEVFRSSMCGADCALQKTLKTGRPVIGKSGYIIDAEGNRIPISVSTAVLRDADGRIIGGAETFRDLSEVEALRQELAGRVRVGDLVSRSPLMQRVFEVMPAIAASPSTVLVRGETGTGKELIARTIHDLSPRREGPFIAVNCGALPDTLLESELFGYKAGAFTGAGKDKPGRFALAKGGSIFLDEIGEISPALQVRLLRVLQEKTYEPLGGTRTETVDARVIVATNRDLAERVRTGGFREDLYYRINVVRWNSRRSAGARRTSASGGPVHQRFNRLQGRSIRGITAEAIALLMAHEWPGNVRELENVIERAFILCREGLIGIGHLPDELTSRGASTGAETDVRSAHELLDIQAIRRRWRGTGTTASRRHGISASTDDVLPKAQKPGNLPYQSKTAAPPGRLKRSPNATVPPLYSSKTDTPWFLRIPSFENKYK